MVFYGHVLTYEHRQPYILIAFEENMILSMDNFTPTISPW